MDVTDPWPLKQNPGAQSRSRKPGIFCLKPGPPGKFLRGGSHIQGLRNRSQNRLTRARDVEPSSESQHFARTRIGATMASYAEPEPQPQWDTSPAFRAAFGT